MDSTNGNPIESVNLFNSTRKIGAYSNSKGVFTVSYGSPEDKIEVSCVGYKAKSFTIKELSKKPIIKLTSITIELSSFTVNSEQSFTEIGCHNLRTKSALGSSLPGVEYATLIKDERQTGRPIHQIILKKKKKSKGKIRLHLYQVQDDGSPGKDLINSNLIVDTEAFNTKKEMEIDVAEYNVLYPSKGVFIGIEWIETVLKDEPILFYIKLTDKPASNITFLKRHLIDRTWQLVKEHPLTSTNLGTRAMNLCVGLRLKY